MIDIDDAGKWFGGLAALVLSALGIRLHASKVSRDVAKNEAEAHHSSGLVEDLNYWRKKSEADSKRAYDAEVMAAQLRADLSNLVTVKEEREYWRKMHEGQMKISADLSRLADARAAQLRHVKDNNVLVLRLLRKHNPGADFSIVDSGPTPLEDS